MTPHPHRMTIISPSRSSLLSRTKKSILGNPIPMLTMLTGTPLYVPVIVKKPRSECKANSPESAIFASLVIGLTIVPIFPRTLPFNPNAPFLSRYFAIVRARAGSPTVISITNIHQDPTDGQGLKKQPLTIRFATSPERRPRWYTLPSAVFGKSGGETRIQGWYTIISERRTRVGDRILHCGDIDAFRNIRRW